ncbi:MAG: hypothetical protein A2041_11475 [Bacteroidetes bacterium GWA2_31_9b]|nr:MAG: hypothetical protein A2041_11475 [Bacteroidetes bacterium GWA2_31_9b]
MEFLFLKLTKMKHLLYLISIAILLSSCVEDYNVKLKSTYVRVVVQGSITDEYKTHQVKLSKSADYFSNQPAEKITDAEVTLSDGVNILNLTETSDGIYETDSIAGIPGNTYTLNIDINGEKYESSCYLNACPPIDSIKFGYYDNIYYDSTLMILLYALEPETPNNFYLWKVHKNNVLVTDTLFEVVFSDDVFINGNYMYDIAVQWVEANTSDTITLEMQSITEEYYDYVNQLLAETVWDGGPFDGPPANPLGNISNGAMGFFNAYSVFKITAIVPEKEKWILLESF